MRQIAAFSAVGLFTACGCVLCLFPLLSPPQAPPVAPWVERGLDAVRPRPLGRVQLALVLLIAGLGVAGATRLNVVNELRLMQASPPQIVDSDRRLRALVKNPTDSQFLLVTGADAESVLENEEALRRRLDALVASGELGSYAALTRALPSRRTQDENAGLSRAQVCGEHGLLARMLARMGYPQDAIGTRIRQCGEQSLARLEPQAWLASPAAAAYRHLWLGAVPGGSASVVTLGGIRELAPLRAAVATAPGVRLVDKVGDISALMARFQRLVAGIVVASHLGLLLIFSFRYGLRDALRVVASPAVACLGTLGVFGLAGEPVNLFSTFSLLLVLGIGIDYAIFLREGRGSPRSSLIAVLVSATTALLSFGLLAFSSTPFIHSIGLTLLCGILLALASALLLAAPPKEAS
jgi:predicted exporter